MATGHGVQTCKLLLRCYFNPITPWAPLINAILINGANILTGDRRKEGFGWVNIWRTLAHLSSSFDKIKKGEANSGFWQHNTDQTKDVTTCGSTVPKPEKEGNKMHLRATVVYHDLPGHEIQNFIGLALQLEGSKDADRLRAYDKTKPQLEWNNVQRVVATEVTPWTKWKIHVVKEQPLLGNSPWGVAWTYFELSPGNNPTKDLPKL
ncbi:hypothetical protein B0J13DRAFT_624522 [Dactylonectria estremocensis]|uniref:Uncharacterized protein n=1 Tax=Dactylonectria estremocensis TaxID=1079267 RepID=A0A9P9EHK8_9HYPO|nr:hypothetical protein B0J13DRAFT_624522 [Dactylonectria estremocensis]